VHRVDALDREVARLAVPALGALLAEPAFLLVDSAIVGHLGTTELAALGVAGTVLATVVSVAVFLAYGTTGAVARLLGAGQRAAALRQGIDGCWLGASLGLAVAGVGVPLAPSVIALFGADARVEALALTYLRLGLLGMPAMLLVLAATGVLRGLQDTRTPLVVAAAGAGANAVLCVLLVYGVGSWRGWGLAGSAVATVLAQTGMALAFARVVARGARAEALPLRPRAAGVRRAFGAGMPLLLRTAAMRVALLATVWAATALGTDALAAHQVAFTTWTFLALALDALAIAAQALVGRALGRGDVAAARRITHRLIGWSLLLGVATGLLLAALVPAYAGLFSPDPAVQVQLRGALLVAAVLQPLAGWVFVLDGVLIGAGDGRFLAALSVLTLVPYLPLVWLVARSGGSLAALWAAFAVWIVARLGLLASRARGDAWLVTGAVRA
jgi:putative MATE family efflux protein